MTIWRLIGAAALWLLLFFCAEANAQVGGGQRGRIEYFRSPYGWAFQADPAGIVLGRMGSRLEMRTDPHFSYYLDYAYDRDIDTLKPAETVNPIPMHSAGLGMRIYLRDNNAVEGLFAGAAVGGTLQQGSMLGMRISAEIGYKWMLFEGVGVFIEPQLLIDSYPFRHPGAKAFFTYIAIPLGIAWK